VRRLYISNLRESFLMCYMLHVVFTHCFSMFFGILVPSFGSWVVNLSAGYICTMKPLHLSKSPASYLKRKAIEDRTEMEPKENFSLTVTVWT